MNPQALLEQLAPLRTPDPVGWWPLAPGWWALITLLLCLLGWAGWMLRQRHARNRYRREATAALSELAAAGADVAALNVLLKSVTLRVFGSAPASLSGQAWIDFLVSRCPGTQSEALAPLGDVYAPGSEPISSDLLQAVQHWFERHEVAHV